MKFLAIAAILAFMLHIPAQLFSQDRPFNTPDKNNAKSTPEGARQAPVDPRFERFAKQLSNVKLVGRFTIVGKEGPLAKEEYTILKVDKLPLGDKWLFHCRIKYGQHDLTLPLPLDVKWADDTPIITLTDLAIPPLGTFSSRVVIHDDKYAGTWRHDNVGGHLFGTIEKLPEDKEKEKSPLPAAKGN